MRILIVLILAIVPALGLDLVAANKAYQTAGRAVIDQVNAKKVDPTAVAALVLEMERQAIPAARAYAAKHPAGTRLIETTIAMAATSNDKGAITGLGAMKDLSFADIGSQWHDLGHFTKVDVGINVKDEANEHFTDPLHSIIHPIMVLRAAMDFAASKDQASLDHMKAEMDEGMEQMEKLTTGLK